VFGESLGKHFGAIKRSFSVGTSEDDSTSTGDGRFAHLYDNGIGRRYFVAFFDVIVRDTQIQFISESEAASFQNLDFYCVNALGG